MVAINLATIVLSAWVTYTNQGQEVDANYVFNQSYQSLYERIEVTSNQLVPVQYDYLAYQFSVPTSESTSVANTIIFTLNSAHNGLEVEYSLADSLSLYISDLTFTCYGSSPTYQQLYQTDMRYPLYFTDTYADNVALPLYSAVDNFFNWKIEFTIRVLPQNIADAFNEQGYDSGYKDGYNNGIERGGTIGYKNGYNTGYSEGLETGREQGVNTGFSNGFNDGYNQGFDDASEGNYTLFSLFGAIADTPIMFLRQLLSFEVFGVQAISILMSMLTGVIVLYLIRRIIF